ncbi:MAG: hypothetical protein AAGC77_12415 [Pseudomonadota bacterium]
MLNRFFGGGSAQATWPLSKVVATLEKHYDSVEAVAEDGPLKIYGLSDNGVNFIMAALQNAPQSGQVIEIGLLARFIGFPISIDVIERLNRNLHISVAAIERDELFLMAGVSVTGGYDEGQFILILNSWRRDLVATIHGIGGDEGTLSDFFPGASVESARAFATNRAPETASGAAPVEVLSRFLGKDAAAQVICDYCGGRGKRGLIARRCDDCDGLGFVHRR